MSHTGIDLESIEAVILFVIVRQDVNSALHKSPMRFFALYEFPYTSVLEMRPADELLCRCLYTPYVVVVVCCLEATAGCVRGQLHAFLSSSKNGLIDPGAESY